jgi:2-dehydropantoate 2-reductase
MSVCIWGAGSIGAYIGGLLIESGVKTLLVGREYLKTEIEAHGLTCTDLDDRVTVLKTEQVNFVSTATDLSEYKYILVSGTSAFRFFCPRG